jgi:hypothetical protein
MTLASNIVLRRAPGPQRRRGIGPRRQGRAGSAAWARRGWEDRREGDKANT